MKPVLVIGHKNPDTDSICSAICYADLKHKLTGETYIPCRAGDVHYEAKYVLETFGVEPPQYLESLEPRLSHVQYRTVDGINAEMSLKQAWEYMRNNNIQTVAVLDNDRHMKGLVTSGDIARFYIEDQNANALAEAQTSYRNIVDALNGELVVGNLDDCFSKGKVVVAAANPDVMEDYIQENDLILLGDRYESQLCSIEMRAGCIVVSLGAQVSKTIQNLAKEANCTVIATPLDTYTCVKLINQAVPVRHIMHTDKIVSFYEDDLALEVKSIVSKNRIRYFPILDHMDRYIGMISQRNLLDMERQPVILVDHNEKDQAVDGIRFAEILEIIDHHRIDSIDTSNPIYFRNQPLGCTATIIALMYQEHQIEIDPKIAGLLCSAILSDTLMFRSPTCTDVDRQTAHTLAERAGIAITEYATAMFNAGSQLDRCSPDEIFHMDYKCFSAKGNSFAVAQVSSVSQRELEKMQVKMLPYLEELLLSSGYSMLFLMLTNVIEETTTLLFVGRKSKEIVELAFGQSESNNQILLRSVVSRKKQLIVPLVRAMEELF